MGVAMDVQELEREARGDDVDQSVAFDDVDGYADSEAEAFLTDDGLTLPDEVQADLEALAASEIDGGASALEAALAEAQREVARQRNLKRQAVARYRDAILAAEPELPPDLVRGESLEEIEESVSVARETVARIRERMTTERPRPFPVGAPERSTQSTTLSTALMSPQAKIAAGLQERLI